MISHRNISIYSKPVQMTQRMELFINMINFHTVIRVEKVGSICRGVRVVDDVMTQFRSELLRPQTELFFS